ncbi:MAG: protein kinase, partial [Polyangiales bacterium]
LASSGARWMREKRLAAPRRASGRRIHFVFPLRGRGASWAARIRNVIREGDRVADYDVVARMKTGGMATLFLGRRTGASGFSKPVAIKVVHPHLADDPSFVEMFVDEALLCARIQHPNVVHVEELREVDGTHLLVMEYVAGCSLGQLLRSLAKLKRRMTPELAVHVAIAVLDGLHAAHELKNEHGQPMEVVHRDVSPDNVLLAWQGHVKLIDFGVAKAMSRRTQTSGSMLKGKIRYMSPEQAFGKNVDRRTDVYALAIVLWECLTMRRLFSGSGADLELLEQVRNPTIEAPSQFVADLPPALDAILLKALAKNPDERFRSAREMRRALADAMPRAAALDGADLAELMRIVMADEIEAQRAKLASDAESLDVPVVEAAADEEPLRTMTISMAGLESHSGLITAEMSATSGTSRLSDAGSSSSGVSSSGVSSSGVSSSGVSSVSASSVSVATPAPARGPSALLYALGGGLLVALAGGITLALVGGGTTESTATPLAPAVEVVGSPPSAPRQSATVEPAVEVEVTNVAEVAAPPSEASPSEAPPSEVAAEANTAATEAATTDATATEPAPTMASSTTPREARARPTASTRAEGETRATRPRAATMRASMRELADDFGF